jgi:ankyrin repeat protein
MFNIPDRIEFHEFRPIHYAASAKLNTIKARPAAISIIRLLLNNGADPWLELNENNTRLNIKNRATWSQQVPAEMKTRTIMHDLFEHGGILEPFLQLPNFDLDRRDASGRTLLLAACSSNAGTYSINDHPDLPTFGGLASSQRAMRR